MLLLYSTPTIFSFPRFDATRRGVFGRRDVLTVFGFCYSQAAFARDIVVYNSSARYSKCGVLYKRDRIPSYACGS